MTPDKSTATPPALAEVEQAASLLPVMMIGLAHHTAGMSRTVAEFTAATERLLSNLSQDGDHNGLRQQLTGSLALVVEFATELQALAARLAAKLKEAGGK